MSRTHAVVLTAHAGLVVALACLNPFAPDEPPTPPGPPPRPSRAVVRPAPSFRPAVNTLSIEALRAIDAEINELMVALQANERGVEALRRLAALYVTHGWFEQAIRPLARATQIEPDGAALWYELGSVLERTGRVGQAVAAFARAAELDAGSAVAAANLARARALTPAPGVKPVDLNGLAQQFVELVEMWGHGC